MNEKKAKVLRFYAREAAKKNGWPKRQLMINQRTGQIINAPQSERGVYRALKRKFSYDSHHGRA